MPVDKFGIPFFYASALHAGNTGAGNGFFWQQNNDFRKDNDAGMIRLGKEQTSCKLINATTGEWEFPYLTDGDGLDMSGPTGHHSGGEQHGCQGFTYMCDTNLMGSTPSFRFRKETYHVQYNDHPDGEWTSPLATGPCINHWKGFGWVAYNKKDGIAPGKDSRICECWWNDDPEGDIANWHMLKRVEDKGHGITDWGVSATCDGDAHQVGTWSNIQFRFKSSSSDFSLHPLIPEGENDPDVHSIGGENMSFSDSAARGYGKRADMPRDIEMKCLVKWDAGGRGKAHFKNISLREIDPTLAFDDNPDTPPPPDQPPTTSTISTSFKFMQDINEYRTQSPCAGTGTGSEPGSGGGGGSGNTRFWIIPAESDKEISNSSTWQNRTRIGEKIKSSSSSMRSKLPIQVDVPLKKVGTPTTPNISCKIWNSSNSVIYTSPTTIDPSTLTTNFTYQTFDFSTNTHTLVVGDIIGIEWTGTSDSSYLEAGFQGDATSEASVYVNYESGSWEEKGSRDWAADIWE